jgi:Holliday junction resolvasome RuvABC endonuclease subunit
MKIIPRQKITGINGYNAKHFDLELKSKEYPIPNDYTTFVGIDPGTRNMGLAFFHELQGKAFDVKIPVSDDRVDSLFKIQECIRYIMNDMWPDGCSRGRWIVCVEDAAFGMRFGQVQLAESRASAIIYFATLGAQIFIVPPASIRKAVFGHGRKKAHEVWKISPNAGAAASCAIYGMLLGD